MRNRIFSEDIYDKHFFFPRALIFSCGNNKENCFDEK